MPISSRSSTGSAMTAGSAANTAPPPAPPRVSPGRGLGASADEPTPSSEAAGTVRIVAWIGILLALAAAALLALAPLGWRLGLWPYATSFVLLRWAAYGAIAG